MGEYKPTVLLSYRRDDAPGTTGRIFDRLVHHYGRERVFMDIDAIPVGVDFRAHIRTYIEKSDVVLVIIGPNWNSTGENGKRRLSNPRDWVRVEIEAAIEARVSLVPVCVDGASIPPPRYLPRSLRDLPYLQAAIVHPGRDFENHAQRLIREVSRLVQRSRRPDRPGRPLPGPFKTSKEAPQPTLAEILEAVRGVVSESDLRRHPLQDAHSASSAPEAGVTCATLNQSRPDAASSPLEEAARILEQRIAALKAEMSAQDRPIEASGIRQEAKRLVRPMPHASYSDVGTEGPSGVHWKQSNARRPIHKARFPGGASQSLPTVQSN